MFFIPWGIPSVHYLIHVLLALTTAGSLVDRWNRITTKAGDQRMFPNEALNIQQRRLTAPQGRGNHTYNKILGINRTHPQLWAVLVPSYSLIEDQAIYV